MNVNQIIKSLKNGKCIKRITWDYADQAYLKLERFNNNSYVYIVGEHNSAPNLKILYRFTFADLEAQDWIEI